MFAKKATKEEMASLAAENIRLRRRLDDINSRLIDVEIQHVKHSTLRDMSDDLYARVRALENAKAKAKEPKPLVIDGLTAVWDAMLVGQSPVGMRVHVTCPDRVDRFKERLRLAAERGAFQPGERVAYRPKWAMLWTGRVIPFPVGARERGKTGEPLIYVLRDDPWAAKGAVRGVYAHNLVRL